MSDSWDDFKTDSKKDRVEQSNELEGDAVVASCDWGFKGNEDRGAQNEEIVENTETAKFSVVYESFLSNRESLNDQTKNNRLYKSNPAKALHEWFDNEDMKLSLKTEQPKDDEYICSLDLPIGDHDFSVSSEVHKKKQDAINEVSFIACKLLDEAELLYPWQTNANEDQDRKRRFDEANKEDDIELDSTNSKRKCQSLQAPKVNNYDSLLAEWNRLNMSILQLKAKLVRLDLSVTQPKSASDEQVDDDEVDPLEEYMLNLDKKTKLTSDEKIEKSRLKSQIVDCEREQSKISRLLNLAKPTFDLNKSCSSKTTSKDIMR